MKLFRFKLSINLKGINQAFYLQDHDGKVELEKINHKGRKSTVLEFKKTAGGFLKLWFWQKRRAVVGCCTLLITGCVSFYAVRTVSTPIEERLYNRYYNPLSQQTSLYTESQAFEEAKKKYAQKDYRTALLLMQNLQDNLSIKKEMVLYQGLSSMGMGNFKEAVQLLDSVAQMPSNKELITWVKWYQGLCYLRVHDFEAAENSFRFISPIFKDEHKKAQRILRKLEKYK